MNNIEQCKNEIIVNLKMLKEDVNLLSIEIPNLETLLAKVRTKEEANEYDSYFQNLNAKLNVIDL